MPFVKRQKQSIDFAPIKQAPFADYWAGEHAVTNDPNLGPWTPAEYEKYKGTTKSEWLKTHPEDWQSEDLFTSSWAKDLIQNLKQGFEPIARAENPALVLTKGAIAGIPSIPGNLIEQFKNPTRYYGEHPEASITDLLMLLGVAGAKGKGMAPTAGRALPGSTVESAAAKALESPEAMFSRYNMGNSMGQKRLQPGPPVELGTPGVSGGASDTSPFATYAGDASGKYSTSISADQALLGDAAKENFIRQLMDKLAGSKPKMLPESAGGTPYRAWESTEVMGKKYSPTESPGSQPIFDPEAASLDAAMKEVDDVLGTAKTKYSAKELRMQKLLQELYKMIGKK